MKIIKRSQLALLSLSFMIMIAGYINYKYDPEREKNLGQTVHVSGSDVFLYENSQTDSASDSSVNIYTETSKNTNDTNMYKNKSYTQSNLATFKEQRDNMFSELEETYKEVISSEQENSVKEKYQKKLDEVVEKKHLIGIVENLIKSKGIKNIVIVPTGENINIMVSSDEKITDTQIAIIESIIEEEFNIEADKISIQNVTETVDDSTDNFNWYKLLKIN